MSRILTYFGIPIPPWRKRPFGSGAVTIRFVITGKIPSKKNNLQATSIRREAYKFIDQIYSGGKQPSKAEMVKAIRLVRAKMVGNVEYRQFLVDQRPKMIEQMAVWSKRLQGKGFFFPISNASVSIRIYFAQRHRQDSVNKQQSIQDLIKDCGIISDDDYITINPITMDADCFHGDINDNIAVIALTFKL